MNLLPEGWKKKSLEDVCSITSNLVDPREESLINLPHIGAGNIVSMSKELTDVKTAKEEGLKSGKFNFDDRMVLYSKIRPYLIKIAIPDFSGLCSADIYPLTPKDEELDRNFLYYLLLTKKFTQYAIAGSARAGMPKVNRDHFFRYKTFFPPLPEQKRIVSILDEAFAGIDQAIANTEKNLVNARELFESYLNKVFTQNGESWEECRLSDLATDITDGDHLPPPKSSSGIPFITISNIHKGTNQIDFSNTFKVPESYFKNLKPNKVPQKGDVLYTVTGSFGIPVIVSEKQHFCFQRHIGLIRPKEDVNSYWLYYLLLSPAVYQQANFGATGTAQKTVSLRVLRDIKVPKVPFFEQEKMVLKLREISTNTQQLESICQQKLNSLKELKQSILQKAFTGELTAETIQEQVN